MFSQLKLIKDNRRTSFGEDTLDQLIWINVEAPPLSQWDPSITLNLWLQDKSRRVNQKDTSFKKPDQSTSQSYSVSDHENDELLLDDWEDWIQDADDSDWIIAIKARLMTIVVLYTNSLLVSLLIFVCLMFTFPIFIIITSK